MPPPLPRTDTEYPPDVLLRYCLTAMALRTERMLPHIVRHMPEYAFLLPACEVIARQGQQPVATLPMNRLSRYLDYCHGKMCRALPHRKPPTDGHRLLRDETYRCARLAHAAGRLLNNHPQISRTE